MTQEEMADFVFELIDVETEEGFITAGKAEGNMVTFTTRDQESFTVTVFKHF
ncbi:MAG: hypothetical protein RR458_01125 [Clostridia bacterium]